MLIASCICVATPHAPIWAICTWKFSSIHCKPKQGSSKLLMKSYNPCWSSRRHKKHPIKGILDSALKGMVCFSEARPWSGKALVLRTALGLIRCMAFNNSLTLVLSLRTAGKVGLTHTWHLESTQFENCYLRMAKKKREGEKKKLYFHSYLRGKENLQSDQCCSVF